MPVLKSSPQIDQIPLRKIARGLAKPIATIRLEPKDISKKLGIIFESVRDDLDTLEAALIRSRSGRQFALVRHRHQPHAGTDILTDKHSSHLTQDLQEVLQSLFLQETDLKWIHPEIEKLVYNASLQREDRVMRSCAPCSPTINFRRS